MKIKLMAEASY